MAVNLNQHVNLLVIEDEQSLLEAVISSATRLGHRVLRVRDGEEACIAMNAHGKSLQVVLLDWSLTCRLVGGELVSAIHKIDPNIPIIILSDWPEEVVMEQIPPGPRVVFMKKPSLDFQLSTAIVNARPKVL